ncbi:MAG TPA: hypothetical protein VIJ12_00745 [Candidatus Baltobacteraceae bacterium]
MRRALVAFALLLLGVAPADSQAVLTRYAVALARVTPPKIAIFSYTISQAGPTDIEQRHRVYRRGSYVRDETLSSDGAAPKEAIVKVYRRADVYDISRVAPTQAAYRFLFLQAVSRGSHIDYFYQTTALTGGAFVVTRVLIDGQTFLPRAIWFATTSFSATGKGLLQYAAVGGHWMPTLATVDATVGGHPARERILWSAYRFPPSLPAATFRARPFPLPTTD